MTKQKAAVAVDMLPLLEKEIEEIRRQKISNSRKNETVENLPPSETTDKSRTQAARLVGTNERYVSDAKKIKQEAPEVFDMLKSGEVNLNTGKTLASVPGVLKVYKMCGCCRAGAAQLLALFLAREGLRVLQCARTNTAA